MSQYYISKEHEKFIGWHIPFTPYFFWRSEMNGKAIWYIVCKEFQPNVTEDGSAYAYRLL